VPKVRSTEVVLVVALTSKNTLRILNTIKPVTRVFTAMDRAKLVRVVGSPHEVIKNWSGNVIEPFIRVGSQVTNIVAPFVATQVARGDKLKSAYQMRSID
jgi:hypothetical protein